MSSSTATSSVDQEYSWKLSHALLIVFQRNCFFPGPRHHCQASAPSLLYSLLCQLHVTAWVSSAEVQSPGSAPSLPGSSGESLGFYLSYRFKCDSVSTEWPKLSASELKLRKQSLPQSGSLYQETLLSNWQSIQSYSLP